MNPRKPYDHVGPYELLAQLAVGPATELWLATPRGQQLGVTRDVVLKIFTASRAGDPRAADAFTQRAERAMTLAHPNILELREAGRVDDDLHCVAMDYVDGINLADFCARYYERHRQPLPAELITHIVGAVLKAVDCMHRAQPPMVHENLSPRSVLLSRAGAVLVTSSCWVPDVRNATTEDLRYKAPEQVDGPTTIAADLFAVGAILHELMDGAVFRSEVKPQQLLAEVRAGELPPIANRPDLPGGLDPLRMALLEREPGDRPSSAAEALHSLPPLPDAQLQLQGHVNELASAKPMAPPRPAPAVVESPQHSPPPARQIPWAKIAAVLAVLAAVVVAFAWKPSDPSDPDPPPNPVVSTGGEGDEGDEGDDGPETPEKDGPSGADYCVCYVDTESELVTACRENIEICNTLRRSRIDLGREVRSTCELLGDDAFAANSDKRRESARPRASGVKEALFHGDCVVPLSLVWIRSCELPLTQPIHFEANSDRVAEASRPIIDELITLLREIPEMKIEIGVHTDGDGSGQANQILSQKRADALLAVLVKSGVASNRLSAVGYGASRPIAPNDNADNKSRNRRVELRRTDRPDDCP